MIDTPGMRELGMWDSECAIAAETLDIARLESYRKLKTENAYAADSSRYLEAKRTKFKEIARINKHNRKR